jgi:uncharacterized protein (TIGR02611 family)
VEVLGLNERRDQAPDGPARDFRPAGSTPLVRRWRSLPAPVRAIAVLVAGSVLVVVGIALLVLPGPGLLVIALGIGVLATEFVWARRVVERARALLRRRS